MARLLLLSMCVLAACAKASPAVGDGGADGVDGAAGGDGGGAEVDAATCAASPCSLLDQCGCGDNQVCDLDRDDLPSGATDCRDVTAPGTEHANCETSTECAGGFGCLGTTDFMQCRLYCDDETDCGDGGHCLIDVTYTDDGGAQQPVPGAVACTKSCALEAASDNGCPSDPQFGCRMLYENPNDSADPDGDEYFLSDCGRAPASGGGDDAACTAHQSCQSGFGCLTFTDGKRCKQYCVWTVDGADGPRVCAAGTCRRFSDTPTIGTTEYGYCD
jgi:hypothetical protein